MTTPPKYAEGTEVTVEKSRAEIESLLKRHGATQFGSATDDERGVAWVMFKLADRMFRLEVKAPTVAQAPKAKRHEWQAQKDERVRVLIGDCRERLRELNAESVQCVVTSPPYFALRDYGVDGQLGLEATPYDYVDRMVEVFREVRRVLRADGTLWLNLGDKYIAGGSGGIWKHGVTNDRNHRAARAAKAARGGAKHERYHGLKPKDLIGLPWRVALALQSDGWWLRSDIIWHKPNAMPEAALDRPARAHEYLFLLAKSRRYHYDADAIRIPLRPKSLTAHGTKRHHRPNDALGQVAAANQARSMPERKPQRDGLGANRRTVWTFGSQPSPFADDHFASFPPRLIEPCILAGARIGDVVLDPFAGTGTVAEVALRHGRRSIAIELSPKYAALIERRLSGVQLPLVADPPRPAA